MKKIFGSEFCFETKHFVQRTGCENTVVCMLGAGKKPEDSPNDGNNFLGPSQESKCKKVSSSHALGLNL